MKHPFGLVIFIAAMLLMVGCDREITGNAEQADPSPTNCFDCHDGANGLGTDVVLAVRQWENSQHGSGNAMRTGSCAGCHTTEGFVEDITGEEFTGGAYNAVGCFACHDPHENADFELRTVAAVSLGNGAAYDRGTSNLCAECHKSRRNVATYVFDGVELSNHFGPHHSNQADMLLGENAYEYDGYTYNVNSWHTTGVAEGCITCHFDVDDGYLVGGHAFTMGTEEEENTDACNVDGCHVNDFEIDDFDREYGMDFDDDGDATEGVQTEIDDMMHDLEALLITAGLLEYIADDDAWEPTEDLVVADADSAGAVYNWAFVHEDQSHGIHNTRYTVALLRSTINYMETGDPDGAPQRPDASIAMMPSH